MTLTDLAPAIFGRPKERKHRHADTIRRLRREKRQLLDRQQAADDYFQRLIADRNEVYSCWLDERDGRLIAESAASQMRSERDEWRDEALRLRARFGAQIAAEANANAVTVPPMVRPIDGPQDEATAPIDVRPLWDALGVGPTTAVTDPGHFPTP